MKREKEFPPLLSPAIETWTDVRWETDPKKGGKLIKFVQLVEERSQLGPKRLTFGDVPESPIVVRDSKGHELSVIVEQDDPDDDDPDKTWSRSYPNAFQVVDVGSVEWKEAAEVLGERNEIDNLADLVETMTIRTTAREEFEVMATERFRPYNFSEVFRPAFVTPPQLGSARKFDDDKTREILRDALGKARSHRKLPRNNLFVALFLPHIALNSPEFYGSWRISADLDEHGDRVGGQLIVRLGQTHATALNFELTSAKEFQNGSIMPARVDPSLSFAFKLDFREQNEVWTPMYDNGSKNPRTYPEGIHRIFVVISSEAKNGTIFTSPVLTLYNTGN
jgi:hypothetical protein